jgi:formylglycine-generating enzyme required for sulfatase activity
LNEELRAVLPDGYAVRLPTEAEWETAASWDQSGNRREYPWGDTDADLDRAVYDEAGLNTPAPVGCCPAGQAACGSLEMAGNMWEWASSAHGAYPQAAANPVPDFREGDWDVPLRGASIVNSSTSVRCGARNVDRPGNSDDGNGFRIVVAA